MRKYPCIHFKKFPPGHPKVGRWEVTLASFKGRALPLDDNERKAANFAMELNTQRGLPRSTWVTGVEKHA